MAGRVIIAYKTEADAKKAFLGYYCGEAKYSRKLAGDRAGVTGRQIIKWFKDIEFFKELEDALKTALRNKSRVRETVLEETFLLCQARITDCFANDPITGKPFLLPFDQIPERTQAAVRELTLSSQKSLGQDGMPVYNDVINIKLQDKTKSLQLMGAWSGIESEERKQVGDNEIRITGLTLIPPEIKNKEITDARKEKDLCSPFGKIQSDPKPVGNIEETWFSE